jgi:arsenate reductase
MKKKVLFICVHNSARSQMAAALLNKRCGDLFEAQSAGLEPGTLNPLAVEALQEIGIDISKTKHKRCSMFSNPVNYSHLSLRFAAKQKPKAVRSLPE